MKETDSFRGTRLQQVIDALDDIYGGIGETCAEWNAVSPTHCPEGCGCCCHAFQPDMLEAEALYLAAWMIYHQADRAEAILNGTFEPLRLDPEMGCYLFDPESPHHCSVYGGRNLVCRLFGEAGDRGKDGRPRWKPCKFLPSEQTADASGKSRLGERYNEAELLEAFGAVPPVMNDIAGLVLALMPDGIHDRSPIYQALPRAIARIRMLQRYAANPDE